MITARLLLVLAIPGAYGQGLEYVKAHYTKYEYQIPMRDGKKLFTSVYVPKDTKRAVPDHVRSHAVQRGAVRRRQLQNVAGPVGEVRAKKGSSSSTRTCAAAT